MKRAASPLLLVLFLALGALPWVVEADPKPPDDLAAQLRKLDSNLLATDADKAKQLAQMLYQNVRPRIQAANERESKAWGEIKTRQDWERYRDARIKALRESLGQFPAPPKDLKVKVTGTLEGDGYRIENLVFESRPGLLVTANLYLPAKPPKMMPGILLCHSHHNPKTEGELQDMGMNWARLGCMVLVMDQLGHGERRQHPFRTAKDFDGTFRVGRQDYYFRYNVAMQLHTIGESLVGWMAWDMMRGVDLLLSRPGIDKDRIILLGAVAGGGDPAAVTAAIDPRITAVVPFNFGGPQPETTYPLPDDAEKSFNYAGGGSWESTRNLRLSARDGFLPWVIVGSVAPRRLVYGHEFAWDRERDPVWVRLEKIYGFYEAREHLAAATGRGRLSGRPPESTHCNNIGAEHRKGIYPAFKKWFGMPEPEREFQQRRPAEELLCLTAESGLKARPVFELASALAEERMKQAWDLLGKLTPEARRRQLQQEWAKLLGEVEPKADPKVQAFDSQRAGEVLVHRVVLETEPGISIPLLLLTPPKAKDAKLPVVVAFAQEGKKAFLEKRSETIAALLQGGVAVCLPDLRGTGETRPGDARGRTTAATSLSSSELMLGQTLVGSRLRDLRSILRYMRSRPDLDAARLALWGDSFAPVNPADRNLAAPLDAEKLPNQAEPLGGLLALFAALFEDDIRVIYANGGLVGYHALLQSSFCYVPHDVIIPGALTAGDLVDVTATLAPRPLRLEGLVDGLNRKVASEMLAKTYAAARDAYEKAKKPDHFRVEPEPLAGDQLAKWLLSHLKDN